MSHSHRSITRRHFLKSAALTAAGLAGAPYIRNSHSAGRLSIGAWEHWLPAVNTALRGIVEDWGRKNRVQTGIDFIPSTDFKGLLTGYSEARARTGHDIFDLPTWQTVELQHSLEPVDDVIEQLVRKQGPFNPDAEYLGRHGGIWRSVPGPAGSRTYPMVSRLDYFKRFAGVDLKRIFPPGLNRDPFLVTSWNERAFLAAAEKLHRAGHPIGNPIGSSDASQAWLGALFRSFGATLMERGGKVTVDSGETRQALEYLTRLTALMPPEIYAWDEAATIRWLGSGKGAAISYPPRAWRAAMAQRPEVAAQLWHHDNPSGPKGRFRGSMPRMWGVWNFARNIPAAKALLLHLSQREQAARLIAASQGYDAPLHRAHYHNPVWVNTGPPRGGLYNYPTRGDEIPMVSGWPAPAAIAARAYKDSLIPNLVARVTLGGEPFDDAIAWAAEELEGYRLDG